MVFFYLLYVLFPDCIAVSLKAIALTFEFGFSFYLRTSKDYDHFKQLFGVSHYSSKLETFLMPLAMRVPFQQSKNFSGDLNLDE